MGPKGSLERGATGRAAPETLEVGRLYREHAEQVSRWTRRLLGPHGDVEDILHEIFLVVQRRLPEFRGDAKVATWLYAITVRVVQDHRRKQRLRRFFGLEALRGEPSSAATPLQALENRRAMELTYRLLDRLSEAERSVLILRELEGLSGEEIAAVTGEAVGTVWVRLHRARGRFRKAFTTWEQTHPGPAAPKETP